MVDVETRIEQAKTAYSGRHREVLVADTDVERRPHTGVGMANEKDLVFNKLDELRPLVEIDVVLEDLTLLDSESSWWPQENRRRALAEGLRRRRFFQTFEECLAMSDLWIALKPAFGIKYLHHVRMMIHDYHSHRQQFDNATTAVNASA